MWFGLRKFFERRFDARNGEKRFFHLRLALGAVVGQRAALLDLFGGGQMRSLSAILQSSSWTLSEGVTFDQMRITSVDWATYPILRFHSVPDSVEVHIVDRPGLPFLGAGEAGQGPAAAAIANAIADATGQRLRDLPLTAAKLKAAVGI